MEAKQKDNKLKALSVTIDDFMMKEILNKALSEWNTQFDSGYNSKKYKFLKKRAAELLEEAEK